MNKNDLILKHFQKKDQLTVKKRDYQQTISSLFTWLIDNDKVEDDKTSKFFPDINCKAKIIAKQEGIISGIEEIDYLIKKYTGLTFKSFLKDGLKFKNHEVIAQISGKSHEILAYERTILNILQRMSGIATATNKFIKIINHQPLTTNHQPYIAATRKTPWMSLDKKAVAVGGGLTHRINLSDGILIKDNHLALLTGKLEHLMGVGMGRASKLESCELIEIEVESEKQAHQVIKAFYTQSTINNQQLAILLDNFSPFRAKSLLNNLGKSYDLLGIIFEASGGIDEGNIKEWAKTGVDILSLGSLTHSSRAANLSLEFKL